MFTTMLVPVCCVLVVAVVNGFQSSGARMGNTFMRRSTCTRSTITTMNAGMAEESASSTEYSFVNKDMRAYAMKLHTPQQAPKEGKAKSPEAFESEKKAAEAMKAAQAANPDTPMKIWQPERINYVQFLVDSLQVYETMESITAEYPILAPLRSTGLERSAALKEDLDWFVKTYPGMTVPPPGPHGPGYAAHLRDLAATSMPKFVCHYYNHMFAHTAGGRMIGKSMADKLLDGTTLKFYQWEGDVKVREIS
jgi:heme oxygenase (biliverdin-producing, ferredoxin)